jgi:hypothetical protein
MGPNSFPWYLIGTVLTGAVSLMYHFFASKTDLQKLRLEVMASVDAKMDRISDKVDNLTIMFVKAEADHHGPNQ